MKKVNMMETQDNPLDDDMPAEIDFSKGTRGKLFQPNAQPNLPVYPEAEVRADLAERTNLADVTGATVLVSIEADDQNNAAAYADDPAFGIWRDREDMADVEAYLAKLRAPRYNRDGSRKKLDES